MVEWLASLLRPRNKNIFALSNIKILSYDNSLPEMALILDKISCSLDDTDLTEDIRKLLSSNISMVLIHDFCTHNGTSVQNHMYFIAEMRKSVTKIDKFCKTNPTTTKSTRLAMYVIPLKDTLEKIRTLK